MDQRYQSGHSPAMTTRKRWTSEELLVALNLYYKLTFGQFHARHPVIVAVASRLGRTPDSLAMKLCNLASLDPVQRLRGISGLKGASKLDHAMWNEFHANLNESAPASEMALRRLFEAENESVVEVIPDQGIRVEQRRPFGPTTVVAQSTVRRGQEYFRNAVLNNFGRRCGVTGISIHELLVASHILPWSCHESERLNVRNGLCLSRIHDAAFDRGLMSFDAKFRLVLSGRLEAELGHRFVSESFGAYSGEELKLPAEAIPPSEEFLAIHRTKIFQQN